MFKEIFDYITAHWVVLLVTSVLWVPVVIILFLIAPSVICWLGWPIALGIGVNYCWIRWGKKNGVNHLETGFLVSFFLIYPVVYLALVPLTTAVAGASGNFLRQYPVLIILATIWLVAYKIVKK